jgi:acyl-CoA-binding protein
LTVSERACYKPPTGSDAAEAAMATKKPTAGGAKPAPAKAAAKAAPAAKAAAAAKPAAAKGGNLDADFASAQVNAKKLSERPDNDTLLRLYALYKQGSEGDVSGARPGMFDFVGGAKYDAWAKLKGTTSDDAKRKYVELVRKLGG